MTGTIGQYQRHLNEFPNGNLGTAATIDFVANGVYQSGVLNSASCTLTFVNPRVHSTVWLELIQDATGGRAFTFPASVIGTIPPLNSAANASTLYGLVWNGTNYQFTSSAAAVAGVSSFNSRSGAVTAAASDYTATQITNTSSVSGAFVRDALNTLLASIGSIVSGVSSFNTRTGAVSPASGDYAASQVTNDSTVAGVGVAAALNTLKSSIAALVTGVSSFKTRTGAVTPAAGDYAASQVNNDSSTVTGTHVSDALDALKALIAASVTGVSSVYGRTGAVVAAIGDYAASQVTNDSTVIGTGVSGALNTLKAQIAALVASSIGNDSSVTGTTTKDALNTLKASIAALVTGVSSVYGRTGAVVAAVGDYAASKITNDSATVSGAHVSDALDALKASISTSVTSVFGRTGAILAATGDYSSTQITNASTVAGTSVTGALNTLSSLISGLVTGVSSVFGRTGAITALAGDYAASKITNDSSVGGAHVSDALTILLREYGGIVSVTANFTLTLADVGFLYSINTGSSVNATIPTAASSSIPVGARFSILLFASSSAVAFVPAAGVTLHTTWSTVQPTTRYTVFHLDCIATNEWVLSAETQLDSNAIVNGSGVPGTDVSSALDNLHDSSGILDASGAGGPTVFASLNTIWSTLINATSSQVRNVSSVVGTTVTDALNTLLGNALIGDISVPIVGQVPGGGTSDWDFWSTGAFWAGGGHNKSIFFALGPIPHGALLTAIKVSFIPTSGHGANLPTILPSFQLIKQTPGNVSTVVSSSLVNVTAASVPAYEVGQQWVSSSFVPQVSNQSSYWLEFFDEGGTHALSGLSVVNITITLA
jgi:hypothetical protein